MQERQINDKDWLSPRKKELQISGLDYVSPLIYQEGRRFFTL
jgi:hypothetical protein